MNVKVEDSGVYTLQALRKQDPNSAVPICFFTLAVLQNVRVRAEEQITLDAHVGELALLYNTLVVRWIRGDLIVKRFTVNPDLQA